MLNKKSSLIIESLYKINEGTENKNLFKDTVTGKLKPKDFLNQLGSEIAFKQIVDYVKSLKSSKEAKDVVDFAGYASKGRDIEDFYNSFSNPEKDELLNYANSLVKKFDNKYKTNIVKLLKGFEQLDVDDPEILKSFTSKYGHFNKKLFGDFYLTIDTKEYTGTTNVNNKYNVTVWLNGGAEDFWPGYVDTYGLNQEIAGPSSCYNNLYTVSEKIYLYFMFEENWGKVEKAVKSFVNKYNVI